MNSHFSDNEMHTHWSNSNKEGQYKMKMYRKKTEACKQAISHAKIPEFYVLPPEWGAGGSVWSWNFQRKQCLPRVNRAQRPVSEAVLSRRPVPGYPLGHHYQLPL